MTDKNNSNKDWLKIIVTGLQETDERLADNIGDLGKTINVLNNNFTGLSGKIDHINEVISGNGMQEKLKTHNTRIKELETANTEHKAERRTVKWMIEIGRFLVILGGALGINKLFNK